MGNCTGIYAPCCGGTLDQQQTNDQAVKKIDKEAIRAALQANNQSQSKLGSFDQHSLQPNNYYSPNQNMKASSTTSNAFNRVKKPPVQLPNGPYMRASGREKSGKGTGNRYGLSSLGMRASGSMIRPMGMGNCTMLTETFMKANGGMIRLMDREHIHILMGLSIPGSGRMISNMVME